MISLIFLCFLYFGCSFGSLTESNTGQPQYNERRIVGGEYADIKYFPYQLAVECRQYFLYQQKCSAAVVSSSFAVSAAHCFYGKKKEIIRLRAGSSLRHKGGDLHYVEEYIWHPGYDNYTMDYDVAVIKVIQPFIYTETVQPIALATITPSDGTPAVVSGWGQTEPRLIDKREQLQKLYVYVFNLSECERSYEEDLSSSMLCVGLVDGKRNVCFGDSGGPLVAGNKLIGIVSWGRGCARPGYPGVYTNVAFVHKWITETIDKIGVMP